jgi:hypothetical protein
VVLVLARQIFKSDAGLRIPAIDVKLDAILPKLEIAGDRVAPGPEDFREEITSSGFGERVEHDGAGFLGRAGTWAGAATGGGVAAE